MFPRPDFHPLPLPPAQDAATAHEFQNLADQSFAGFDRAVEAHGNTLARASSALATSQADLAAVGSALGAAAGASGSMLKALDSFRPADYLPAVTAFVDGVSSGTAAAAAAVGSIPEANFTVGAFPSNPSFQLPTQLPTLTTAAGSGSTAQATVTSALWRIGLGAQILQLPLGVSANAAFGGSVLTLGGTFLPTWAASALPIIGAVAFAAALPFAILSLLGINLSGPSSGEIKFLADQQCQLLTSMANVAVQQILGAGAYGWLDPAVKAQFADPTTEHAYRALRAGTVNLFNCPWNYAHECQAAQLTRLAQAWTKKTGLAPPAIDLVANPGGLVPWK